MATTLRDSQARADEVKALARLRRSEGVRLYELAREWGRSPTYLSLRLSGQAPLTRDQVKKLRALIQMLTDRNPAGTL